MTRITIFIAIICLAFGCNFEQKSKKTQRSTLFVGIDVSGSFTSSKRFTDGIKFLSYYLYAHLNNLGGLSKPTDLYVGGIGGNQIDDPLTFYPIHDFINRTPDEIEAKLLKEFSQQKNNLTDFNTYFKRLQTMTKQKNLVLAPISVVMLTDGVPEIAKGPSAKAIKQAYSKIDLTPLEYLTRNISIRILYADPKVGNNWRSYVPTKRIRIWTVEPNVMYGWEEQLNRNGRTALWAWIRDNVDLQIRSRGI